MAQWRRRSGHFAPGETVNFDAAPIGLDESLVGASGVLAVERGHALVRWNTADPDVTTDFDAYLADPWCGDRHPSCAVCSFWQWQRR